MRSVVIVIGLGAMGSAAAYELSRRGVRVLGLDANAPPHALGSSHGRSRIIREAYFEDPAYVPLVRRAYERWSELEAAAGESLFRSTGGLMIGPADGALVRGAQMSARTHRVSHEMLDAPAIRARWPVLHPRDDMVALLEPRAGILFPERCVAAHLRLARAAGATLRPNERVTTWSAADSGVSVTTARGDTYVGDRLILAAGAWLPRLLGLPLPLDVERQVIHWFDPRSDAEAFAPERCPITLWEAAPDRFFYTFPDLGDGVKAAIHHDGERADPDAVDRTPTPVDEARVRSLLQTFMPAANGRSRDAMVCMYTNTPDQHFLLDLHPMHANVVIASPCSGHGFKFASAIGEVLADLAMEGRSRFDLRLFGIERLLAGQPGPAR